ncbi:hypothetical protein [Undibacterium sp. Tian12W]|uniref:hypothetical protein n=1 Tax=Undibacterium sp. Tian12W TaxID=3413054 RepID=UPI003BF1D57F
MKAIISIWMQPVYGRINAGSLKSAYFILALICLIPFVELLSVTGYEPSATAIIKTCVNGLGSVLLTILFFWFIFLIPSIATQYTPTCANLVPHMKRRMQAALALPILLIPLLFPWILRMHGKFFQGWFFGVIAMLVYVATLRNKPVIILLIVLTQLPAWLFRNSSTLPMQLDWNQPVLLVIAGFSLTALILRWVFSVRGDELFKVADSIPTMIMYMRGEEAGMNAYSLKFLNPYHFFLRRSMEKVRAVPEKVGQLIAFSIGSQAFWLSSFIPVVVMSAGLSIYFVFYFHDSSKNQALDHSVAYLAALVSFIMLPPIYAAVVRSCVSQRREEQGLLLLAPNLPNQRGQGKTILGFILGQYLGLWLVSTVFALSAAYLCSTSDYMHEVIWLISFSLLPVSFLSLTNYAHIPSSYQSSLLAALTILIFLGLAVLGLHELVPRLPVWLICSLIAGATAAILRRRWQTLMQAEALFPVCRAV